MHFTYDHDVDAVYVSISDAAVARTVEIDPLTLADVDRHGQLVGLEVIKPDRDLPLERVFDRFNLPPTARENLTLLLTPDEHGRLPFGSEPMLVN